MTGTQILLLRVKFKSTSMSLLQLLLKRKGFPPVTELCCDKQRELGPCWLHTVDWVLIMGHKMWPSVCIAERGWQYLISISFHCVKCFRSIFYYTMRAIWQSTACTFLIHHKVDTAIICNLVKIWCIPFMGKALKSINILNSKET